MSEMEREIHEYIAKYATKHNLTIDEAKESIACKLFKDYKEKQKNVTT